MSFRRFFDKIASTRAPGITGAVFCLALALTLPSCEKKAGTPDWDSPGGGKAAESTSAEKSTPSPAPAPVASATTVAAQTPPADEPPANESSNGLRFISYNVENWLTMDRRVGDENLKNAPKPDSEKRAVVDLLVKNRPDVLGLCEIGAATDLAELQEMLKNAGLNLPNSHYTGGSDPTRHLALLSKFPIVSTAKAEVMEYQMNGQTFGFNRGVMDATVQANGGKYRFLGVHLKSKRDVEEGDQEQMRINEAHLLRRHVDSILKSDPDTKLIVYGDFNDTYPSKALRAVTTGSDESLKLKPIYLKDSRGEAWTHHWSNQDIYSRIDFIMVSQAMNKHVQYRDCHIIDDAEWDKASDHRPLLAIFR